MEYLVKKTTELSDSEQEMINSLFNSVFKRNRTITEFRNGFLNTPLGYSYHSLIIDNGIIVGCNSYIPSYYIMENKRFCFVTGCDTMIDKPCRDFFNYYDMMTTAKEYLKENGIPVIYGFPNDEYFKLVKKRKKAKVIGALTTYCLPYRIGGIKPKLKLLNCLSILFAHLYIFFTALFAGKKVYHFAIEKEAETYNDTRYKRYDGNYNIVTYQGSGFVYKIMEYKDVRSAFLIDVFEKSASNFNKAIKYIIKNHRKDFDILLYVGRLPFRWHGLIQLPQKLAPKNFNFTGEILRKGEIDEDLFFNIDNWDINLSNYDLL
jgi:hypothetical protein